MGFTLHFYIIFWTNLLTGGPTQIAVFFAYFSASQKRNIKRSPNGIKPSGELFLEQTLSIGLGVDVKKEVRRPRGCPACPGREGAPPALWAPRGSTDVFFLLYIYPRAPQEIISTTATFCIREIPSWSLRRRSAGGGIDHGGPLHHHQGLSDEL